MNRAVQRVAVAIIIVLLGIWAGSRFYAHRVQVPPSARVVPAQDAHAPTGDDAADAASQGATLHPVIPTQLPHFSLNDLSGKPTPISTWSGKSLVINFWATWCAPCRREIPLLKVIASEWAARDITVVGIAVDYKDKVAQFARQFEIGYPLLVGEQDAMDVTAQFGMASPAFPFTVFTDRRGEVVALFVGELHRQQADFILSVVQQLNENRLQLPEARRSISDALSAMAPKRSG